MKIKFYPITKIGILDILTKLYIIYAYILIAKPKRQNEKESDNRPTLDHAHSSTKHFPFFCNSKRKLIKIEIVNWADHPTRGGWVG
jgi:hypothetical protein